MPELVETKTASKIVKKTAVKKTAPIKKVVKVKAEVAQTSTQTKEKVVKKTASKKEAVAKKAAPKKAAKPKAVATDKAEVSTKTVTVNLRLKFFTHYGQTLFITGNHPVFGNGNIAQALPMQYFNQDYWTASVEFLSNEILNQTITYNYVLKNLDGSLQYDCGEDKFFNPAHIKGDNLLITDGWNYTGYAENAFYTEPFKNVLLAANHTEVKTSKTKTFTHTFKTKSPLLPKGQTLCLLGSGMALGNWDISKPILMSRAKGEDNYVAQVNLGKENFPIAYKYGVYDVEKESFVRYEDGDNRFFFDNVEEGKQTLVNDAFANLPSTAWRGAGIAIPVFSLKTESSFGVGEFTDLIKLADWSESVGLKLIQILPINDTTAHHSWQDSYPYAAISAFALHPIYLNIEAATATENKHLYKKLAATQKELNAANGVEYDKVIEAKWSYLKQIYPLQKQATFESEDYKSYFETNKHWLLPYAVFCYLRDEYGTANFYTWPAFRTFKEEDVAELTNTNSEAYNDIAIHYFVQYHLHLQLKQATDYAHKKGIIVKGDIAIGIYRYGVDAWQNPELYHIDVQAGAPPDDFAVKGQNWGFPTYNWERMAKDGFAWWKQRFEQMRYYFDAFRIDHILGFFRIWSIPMHAVEGIMGYFVPAIPLHINEIFSRGIDFNYHRFTKPYITESILWDKFDYDTDFVKENFVEPDGYGHFNLKEGFATQRQVEQHFDALEQTETNDKLRFGLYDLISNVILFEVEGSQAQQFHFRFGIETTSSFGALDYHSQQQLKDLYVNYFFRRQDDFWMKEAMQKLPALRRTTNMLICGEDLGLVPACVPDVMKQLGMLSLEIQRMPKDPKREFFHPNDAPYLSVVTPSTHDMSTIRGWWEEDKARIQRFYNFTMGQWGDAPYYCEAWINKAIVLQHLYSPAMWAIFQFQDLIGMDENLRRENPNDERINVPSNPKHYWRYRMNLSIEELQNADSFNAMLKDSIGQSGR